MTLRELLSHLRVSVLRDTNEPSLWSDAELIAFLNEAQNVFVTRTHWIVDDSATYEIVTTPGQQEYTLGSEVVRVNAVDLLEAQQETVPSVTLTYDGASDWVAVPTTGVLPVEYTAVSDSQALVQATEQDVVVLTTSAGTTITLPAAPVGFDVVRVYNKSPVAIEIASAATIGGVASPYTLAAADQHASELRDGTRHQVKRTYSRGRPYVYGTQHASRKLRLHPAPDDQYLLQLSVVRLPERMNNLTDECEIPEMYELALCDYAAWRAMKNNDPEGANMEVAADFLAAYKLVERDAKRDLATYHRGVSAQARGNFTGKRYRGR